jgi:hypothetical protein
MSAEFNTEIKAKGTKEELFKIITAIFNFNAFSKKKNKKSYAYLEDITITITGVKKASLFGDNIKENDIKDFVQLIKKEIKITAVGPYGDFSELSEVKLFEYIAEAAPTAYFKGCISGFSGSADQSIEGELTNSRLVIEQRYADSGDSEGDDEYGQYVRFIKGELPYSKFCRLFKVNKDEFDEECYNDLINDTMDESLREIDYETFNDCCASEMEEDEFYEAMEEISDLNLITFEEFMCEGYFDEDCGSVTLIYDPIIKEYIEEECSDEDYDDEDWDEESDDEDWDEEYEDY